MKRYKSRNKNDKQVSLWVVTIIKWYLTFAKDQKIVIFFPYKIRVKPKNMQYPMVRAKEYAIQA